MLDYLNQITRKGTCLTRKGYILNKNDFSEKEIRKIKNQLTVKPVVHRDYAHFAVEFPVFYESKTKLYLPRYWGLEKFGPPEKIDICDGKSINLKCIYEPRPIQKPIIKRALSILQNPFDKFIIKSVKKGKDNVEYKLYGGGTIISIYCGGGKTFCALYIMTKLAQKTLIIVHTSVLLTQWIERIEQFVPGAKVGIIKGKKCDVEDKDIVIAMLQTLVSENRVFPRGFFDQFGLAIADEVHHLAAPTFSRALPIMATKYFLGLSATPTRNDKLEKVFYWHLGYIGNDLIDRRGGQEVIIKYINYTNTHFREIRRYNARTHRNDAYDIPKMVDLIISCKRRLKLIRFQLKIFAEQGRQILVLSSRKQHLKDLKENFDNFNYTKIINDQEVPITTGYYMGGMKKMDLEKSAKCDIIYGTFNLVAEGTDIPTLNTLLMACPRKEVEQVVGRILRANTGFIPIVIDIADNFSIFVNQGTYRQRFYKRQKYHIDVFDIDKENYKIVKLKDTKQTEGLKIRRRKKQEEVVFKKLAICIDSDDE